MSNQTAVKENPLGTERIGKLVLTFSVPSIISMVVNALYNIVDQIFIGQGVGYLGNGATNVVMPLTVIVISVSLLIGDGAAAYLSLKLGEGDGRSAARGVGCAISVTLIAGLILCILFNLFLAPLCVLFGATEDILPYAVDYGHIISLGVLFSALDSGMAGMIRADGSPKYSMAGLLVGCITNIILDPIFIFVFHWGVKGAAWATILGQILNAFLYFAYIWKFKSIKLDRECFRISRKVLAKVCSLGVSSFITQIAIVVVMAVTNNVLVSYGAKSVYGAEIPLTTIGITMKVNQIISAVTVGLATGVFFQAIGKPTQATVLSLSRQIVYLIPATVLLPLVLGVEGALWAGPAADVLAFTTTLVMLKIYWKKI